ncbi:peptidyl-tRNA hydrolase [Actinokineospora guangxiensis]|uniref:peptidyl-tRNA hydrolase n=1 Tax=Actinokineospora guangxiensis TaxID=1490288 RepID=A0ABW0ES46_9PSEU
MSVLSALFSREVRAEEDDPLAVRAMPVVLRVERDLPGRTPLLEAAAAAAVALCLDERAQPGGEWHDEVGDWVDGRIRKVSRRARGAHWAAVGELPGVTVEVGGAAARALLPWRVADLPKAVSRLQISGTELPEDTPGPVPAGVPVLWLNPAVPMTVGKLAAQVGHGSMLLAALAEADGVDLTDWNRHCAVRTAEPTRWPALAAGTWAADGVVAVRDAGFTEVDPGTVTVVAQWPGQAPD